MQVGLGVDEALAMGPVATGVAQWQVEAAAGDVAYLVFPGNVGDEHALTDLVRAVVAS